MVAQIDFTTTSVRSPFALTLTPTLSGIYSAADQSDYVPDLIHGDLDSMRPEVGEFFSSRGALIRENADQDMHDLDKCLSYLQDVQAQGNLKLSYICLSKLTFMVQPVPVFMWWFWGHLEASFTMRWYDLQH